MPLTPRQQQTVLWSLIAAVLIWALFALGTVLTPFIAALILAYATEPLVRWLVARRIPRVVAVTLTLVMLALVITALVLVIVPIIQHETRLIRAELPGLAAKITDSVLPWINERLHLNLTLDTTAIGNWLRQHLSESGEDLFTTVLAYARSGWSAALQVIGLVFLVPVVLFYLLLDWPRMIPRLKEMVPPRFRPQVYDIAGETDGVLGNYLRGQALVMLALAVYYSLGLLAAGFKMWLPIGVLTGLLVAVPYLGFALGLVFALITGMLQFGPLYGLIAVAVVYGIGQVVESVYLTPKLVGGSIGLHPVAVIFALIAFGSVFGFVGVLLALPMAAILSVALKRLRGAYFASDFYTRTR